MGFPWKKIYTSAKAVLAFVAPQIEAAVEVAEAIVKAPGGGKQKAKLVADNLPAKVHDVLACFRDQLGVRSFNLALHQAPIGPVDEDWSDFPNVVRIVDRGDPHTQTSDMGTMELYAASVVASDPFRVAEALAQAVR